MWEYTELAVAIAVNVTLTVLAVLYGVRLWRLTAPLRDREPRREAEAEANVEALKAAEKK